jgi:hypothetical protein
MQWIFSGEIFPKPQLSFCHLLAIASRSFVKSREYSALVFMFIPAAAIMAAINFFAPITAL